MKFYTYIIFKTFKVCCSCNPTHPIFVQVIWSRLYKYASRGTLYHLRNLNCRKNVRNDPEKDVNACEDFLLTVQSHILSAARTIFGMDSLDDQPESTCSLNMTKIFLIR